MNNKGFTLIELLAVLVLLSIIALISVPNVMGIIENNKRATYIADGERMVAQAEAVLNASTSMIKPTNNNILTRVYLSALDTTDFKVSPDGYNYSKERSFVAVRYNNKRLEYWIHLVSVDPNNSSTRGISLTKADNLSANNRYTFVTESIADPSDNSLKTAMFATTTGITINSYS